MGPPRQSPIKFQKILKCHNEVIVSEVTRGSKPLFAPLISGVSYINWYFPMLGWTFSVIIMAESHVLCIA